VVWDKEKNEVLEAVKTYCHENQHKIVISDEDTIVRVCIQVNFDKNKAIHLL
jgi:hypothetical protein